MKAIDISPGYHQMAPPSFLPFYIMYVIDGSLSSVSYSHAYNVCPSCGVPILAARPWRCSCGTYIWVCFIDGNKCVQAFAIPDPIFLTEEDVI